MSCRQFSGEGQPCHRPKYKKLRIRQQHGKKHPSTSPLIFLILPGCNREAFVGEAIESILRQTYENFELIIVDDGSTDGSAVIIEAYEEICRPLCQRQGDELWTHDHQNIDSVPGCDQDLLAGKAFLTISEVCLTVM